MNCLQFRRTLLASPRSRSQALDAHADVCSGCARLAVQLDRLERDVEDAALVPVPDALAERILLRRRRSTSMWRYTAAAAFVLAVIGAGVMAGMGDDTAVQTVQAVGPTHPGVAAIAEVSQEREELVPSRAGADDISHGLRRLGLALKPGEVSVYHLGKCRVEGGSDCERIVISTRDVHADVLLLGDYPLRERLLIEDRHMVALISPAGSGAYIVVAQSPKAARRVEKLFHKS